MWTRSGEKHPVTTIIKVENARLRPPNPGPRSGRLRVAPLQLNRSQQLHTQRVNSSSIQNFDGLIVRRSSQSYTVRPRSISEHVYAYHTRRSTPLGNRETRTAHTLGSKIAPTLHMTLRPWIHTQTVFPSTALAPVPQPCSQKNSDHLLWYACPITSSWLTTVVPGAKVLQPSHPLHNLYQADKRPPHISVAQRGDLVPRPGRSIFRHAANTCFSHTHDRLSVPRAFVCWIRRFLSDLLKRILIFLEPTYTYWPNGGKAGGWSEIKSRQARGEQCPQFTAKKQSNRLCMSKLKFAMHV